MRGRRSPLSRAGWPLVAACLFASDLAVVGAQDLGRLFSTPQERDRLDALRRSGEPASPEAPVSSRLTVNGLVMRELGPDSVWINGERVSRSGRTREGIRVRGEAGARVRVTLPRGAGTVRLKAGQKVDLATGTVRDAYEADPAVPAAPGTTPAGAGTLDSRP